MSAKYDILDILIEAKNIYYKQIYPCGICYCIKNAVDKLYNESLLNYYDINKIIPEFNPQFLNVSIKNINGYWWNIHNKQSRIDAFNKLINHYKKI